MKYLKKKNYLVRLIKYVFAFFVIASSASAGDPISLKGISLTSSIEDIEKVLGQCVEPDERGFHYCGGSDTNSYKIGSNGEISEIWFECSIIGACDKPLPVLVEFIKSQRSMITTVVINEGNFSTNATLYGAAGEMLQLVSMEKDQTNSFLTLKVGSPVNLD